MNDLHPCDDEEADFIKQLSLKFVAWSAILWFKNTKSTQTGGAQRPPAISHADPAPGTRHFKATLPVSFRHPLKHRIRT